MFVTPKVPVSSLLSSVTQQCYTSYSFIVSPTHFVVNIDSFIAFLCTGFSRRWLCLSLQVSGKLWWLPWVQLHYVQGAQTGDYGRQSPDNVSVPLHQADIVQTTGPLFQTHQGHWMVPERLLVWIWMCAVASSFSRCAAMSKQAPSASLNDPVVLTAIWAARLLAFLKFI